MDPGITRNPISAKVDFCNTFHAKCMFFQSQTPKFGPKNQQKKQPGNRYEKIFFFGPKMPKKLSEWVPKITKKPTKSKPGPHRVLPCARQCPRIVPGSSQGPLGRYHGQQNPLRICKNLGLDLKDSFVMLPSAPKSAQGPPRRQSEAINHAFLQAATSNGSKHNRDEGCQSR